MHRPMILEKENECGKSFLMGCWKLKLFTPGKLNFPKLVGGKLRMKAVEVELQLSEMISCLGEWRR